MRVAIATTLVASLAVSAYGQGLPRNLGPKIGAFLPADREMRNIFGDSVISFGFGSVSSNNVRQGRIAPTVSVITADKNGNHLFLLPINLSYEQLLGDEGQSTVPYARVGAGAYYADYGITQGVGEGSTRYSGKRVGTSAFAELGLTFSRRARVGVRYYQFSEMDNFKFSGVEIFATIDLIRF